VEHRTGAHSLRGLVKLLATFRQRNSVKARKRHHLQSFQRGSKVLLEAPMGEKKKAATRVVRKASQNWIMYNIIQFM
jgi:hypothetical protein